MTWRLSFPPFLDAQYSQYSICGKTRGGQQCIFLTIFDYFSGVYINLRVEKHQRGGVYQPLTLNKSSIAKIPQILGRDSPTHRDLTCESILQNDNVGINISYLHINI